MPDPIDVLMNEHRVIEKVLTAVETAANKDLPVGFYERVIDFIANYADGCHHAKEEDRLFPMLEDRGVPREGGPIGVMCHEHVVGREHVAQMRAMVQQGDLEGLRRVSLSYAGLLRDHIQKEDNILFAMARDMLSDDDVARLRAQFEETKEEPEYEALADRLLAEAGVSA